MQYTLTENHHFHPFVDPFSQLRNRAYAYLEILLELMFHLIVLFAMKKSLKFKVQKMGEICHHSLLI